MTDFCYWEVEFIPPNTCRRTKWLLVKDEKDRLTYKFNLTKMGVENISSFDELKELFPPATYYTI